jgi:hypothetical protein
VIDRLGRVAFLAHAQRCPCNTALGDRALFSRPGVQGLSGSRRDFTPSVWVRPRFERLVSEQARLGQGAFPQAETLRERLRQKLACSWAHGQENLALVSGTSHALTHLALSFPWRPGDGPGPVPGRVSSQRHAVACGSALVSVARELALARRCNQGPRSRARSARRPAEARAYAWSV